MNLCLWMARADRQIICRFWSTLACFGLKTSSYILPLLALKNRMVVLCSSTSLSVHHLGQFLNFLGAQERVFNIFSAELLSYLEFIFSCISSSFFSRCSWGVWALQNDFLGFWLLWSCSWQNVFPKIGAIRFAKVGAPLIWDILAALQRLQQKQWEISSGVYGLLWDGNISFFWWEVICFSALKLIREILWIIGAFGDHKNGFW